jgi:hypothetical protein
MIVGSRQYLVGSFFVLFQVFNMSEGSLYSVIDSQGCKLKRPTGVVLSQRGDHTAYVVDIGHDCVRKYRYK